MTYEITLKKHLKALEFTIVITIGIILFGIYFLSKGKSIFIGIIYFLITFLPVLYLHLEYYLTNRNAKLVIDDNRQIIKYHKGDSTIEINFNDVNEIVFNMAPSFHRRSKMRLLSFEPYHYAKIISNDGHEITITSLMIEDIEPELSYFKKSFFKKKRIFASIKLEKVITDLFGY